jgi:carbon-monoxide dehydrogenase small subunit
MSATEHYTLSVNGRLHEIRDAWIGESLLFVLRERLGLYGTKGACEQGECGSCTILMDDKAVCSCLVLAATAVGSEVTTVEGLTGTDGMNDVQTAFVEQGAVQCGFCTPGLIVAITHLLDQDPNPSESKIKESISGNICRCTGYGRIFEAIEQAIKIRGVAR